MMDVMNDVILRFKTEMVKRGLEGPVTIEVGKEAFKKIVTEIPEFFFDYAQRPNLDPNEIMLYGILIRGPENLSYKNRSKYRVELDFKEEKIKEWTRRVFL